MAYIVGQDSRVTRFSYLEYQALMLVLALTMCFALAGVEVMMQRFQILPLLLPGVFSIRERRFFFFDSAVSDEAILYQLRSQAKALVRIVLCVVLSYLWQHCVLRTAQVVGQEFPSDQCILGMDCFASELHYTTLFSWDHMGVNCSGCVSLGVCPQFESRVVVSCIQFVQPAATEWLMHLAIAHSVTQMTLKSFEVLVWSIGNSPCARKVVGLTAFFFVILLLVLYFANILTEFVSDWVTFVMSMSVPAFFYTVWTTSKVLQRVWREECTKAQQSIEDRLNDALAEFPLEESAEPVEDLRSLQGLQSWNRMPSYLALGKTVVHAGGRAFASAARLPMTAVRIPTVAAKQLLFRRAISHDADEVNADPSEAPVERGELHVLASRQGLAPEGVEIDLEDKPGDDKDHFPREPPPLGANALEGEASGAQCSLHGRAGAAPSRRRGKGDRGAHGDRFLQA